MPKALKKTVNTKTPVIPIGCHVSMAGGVWNAPKNAHDLGCEVFQCFTRSPQGGPAPKIDSETIEKFKAEMDKYRFDTFVIHCPYYINFGSGNPRTYHGSSAVVRAELDRGSLLGASFVMFHPGSGKDLGLVLGMKQAKEGFKKVLDGYGGSTKLLIEIAAGAGEVLGDTFEEIAELMEPIRDCPGFGGICFDTQHAFASGYDLRSSKAVTETFAKFDKIIGLEWLKMCHANDSKVELGARKDRHEHIGEGIIGQEGFGALLEYFTKKSLDIPLILETEHDKVEADITILKYLRDNLKK